MEKKVWGIEGVRKHIFSYLRTKPFSSCYTCGFVFQWNTCGKSRANSITYYGVTQCSNCYKEYNMQQMSCMSEYL